MDDLCVKHGKNVCHATGNFTAYNILTCAIIDV
jgi:hypothetical protein